MIDSDIESVHSIEKDCFSNPWPLESFRYILSDQMTDCWVIKVNREVAGYLIGAMTNAGYLIANLAISGKFRQQGLASCLISFAEQNAKERRIFQFLLDVRESNQKAVKLYLKHGFIVIGKRKAYYTQPTEDSLVMFKNLPPVQNF